MLQGSITIVATCLPRRPRLPVRYVQISSSVTFSRHQVESGGGQSIFPWKPRRVSGFPISPSGFQTYMTFGRGRRALEYSEEFGKISTVLEGYGLNSRRSSQITAALVE